MAGIGSFIFELSVPNTECGTFWGSSKCQINKEHLDNTGDQRRKKSKHVNFKDLWYFRGKKEDLKPRL